MRSALGALLPVVGAGPGGFVDGLGCEVDEGLAQELGALEAPVHPGAVATALGDWGDAGAFLQLGGTLITISVFAEAGQKPRGDDFPSAR